MNLTTFLKMLPVVGPSIASTAEFVEFVEDAIKTMKSSDDQATAREALADVQADNAEGFARLDAKLEAAKNR